MAKTKNHLNLTIFGEETFFEGKLEYTDNLVITGKFKGTIVSSGSLEIAKTANCDVDSMTANEITIAGNVKGNVVAKSKLEMNSGSKIEGDVNTKKLRIADNVDFKGKISMFDKIPDIDIFSVTNSEYKSQVQQSLLDELDENKSEEENSEEKE